MECVARDLLPDGRRFVSWERPLAFRKTYCVAQEHPRASDDNPGTSDQPLRTISWAAALVEPGERVLIDSGVYRECVRPHRGGSGPEEMISFEAAPKAKVIITGTEIWETDWVLSTGWSSLDNVV